MINCIEEESIILVAFRAWYAVHKNDEIDRTMYAFLTSYYPLFSYLVMMIIPNILFISGHNE